jgi:hypothetical protein
LWFNFDQAPAFKIPQRNDPDQNAKSKIRENLTIALEQIYFEEGLVKSLTSFFGVSKGDLNIHMVYDGTLYGLNKAPWPPWFSLPNSNTLLRIVETGTFMRDAYIGEIFLNFFLDPNLRTFAEVDLTKFFPEHGGEGKLWWFRWARIAMGLWSSPFIAIQIMACLEDILFGDRREKVNIFT